MNNDNIPQFNENIFNKYNNNLKAALLFKISLSDVNKLIEAGFTFDFKSSIFLSKINIYEKCYFLTISYYDTNTLCISHTKIDEKPNKQSIFLVSKKTEEDKINCIDILIIRFEMWLKSTKQEVMYYKIANLLNSKILTIDFKTSITDADSDYKGEYTEITTQHIKRKDKKVYNYKLFDLYNLEKLYEHIKITLEEIKNKKSFKEFISDNKDDVNLYNSL